MAALVFDSGALIAIERGDRKVAALLATAVKSGADAVTSTACVAQVWRDPARQARLTRTLAGFVERDLDRTRARDHGSRTVSAEPSLGRPTSGSAQTCRGCR